MEIAILLNKHKAERDALKSLHERAQFTYKFLERENKRLKAIHQETTAELKTKYNELSKELEELKDEQNNNM